MTNTDTMLLEDTFNSYYDGKQVRLNLAQLIQLHNELCEESFMQGYNSLYSFMNESEDAYASFAKDFMTPRVLRRKSELITLSEDNDGMIAVYE